MIPSPVQVEDRLRPADIAAVRALVEVVERADGSPPLSDHVLLHLPQGGDTGVRHLLVHDGGRLVGYAHLDVTDAVAGSSAELAVSPDARGRGHGRALVERLVGLTPDGRLRLWAHGDQPAAAALAAAFGFARARVLLRMQRRLDAPLPEASFPAGVEVRAFEPGRDDEAWLALNARAFATHPEQGSWDAADLRLRMAEPWFDPHGFFLAVRREPDGGERLVGFHWTKVHGGDHLHDEDPSAGGAADHVHGDGPGQHRADDPVHHPHAPIGEVYVVGVDPDEQGRGLGPALTLLGLRSLQERGLPAVLLYVDESNTAAVRTYERLGFRTVSTDISYARG